MKSVSGKKLCKVVEKKGWILRKVKGGQYIYTKPIVDKVLSIPVHKNQDLNISTLKDLMKIAGLTARDL